MSNAHFKSDIQNLKFLTLQRFRLPNGLTNGLPACLPAVRPSSTMARAPVFSHDTCIIGGFCHTTDGPPTIGPPGPSAAAMDGPPGPCTAATLGPGGTIHGN